MKFSYNWLRELVPGLELTPSKLAQQITMKTAECEGVHKVGDDSIIEIDNKSLTNRPDLWGHLGMAREVAAISGLQLAQPAYAPLPSEQGNTTINIYVPELCPRFTGLRVENIKVAPSPEWMQRRLESLDHSSISNLVDITNYVMNELGQPMHAFDADLLGSNILVRQARKDETIRALNGEEYALDPSDIMVTDGDRPVGIGGVIGGQNTAISGSTKNVLFEAAAFKAANVRKTSSRLKLRTDASMRFEKGQDPENTLRAQARAIELLKQLSPGAKPVSFVDQYERKLACPTIALDIDWAERKLGRSLITDEVIAIFKALTFGVEMVGARRLKLTVPSWRATKDISIPEDLVEEIGRMVGYASIVPQAPAILASPVPRNLQHEQHRAVRAAMAGQGFTEVFNYSFIPDDVLPVFDISKADLLEVANPISPEQKYLRPSLLPSVRKNVEDNARYFSDFRLFEIGKQYKKGTDGPDERTHLLATIYGRATDGANLLELKRVAHFVLPEFAVSPTRDRNKSEHPERTARLQVGGQTVGRLFELHPDLLDRGRAAILDIDLDALQALPPAQDRHEPLRRFPTSSFDLSIVAGTRELVGNLERVLREQAGAELVSLQFLLIFPLPPDKKSVSFRLTVGADDHTLTADELTRIRDRIISAVKKAGYELRE